MNPERLLLQRIRDESHRSARDSHRRQKRHYSLQSILYTIPGLGKKRIQALYKAFKFIDSIQRASVEQITHIPSIGPQLAKKIIETLKKSY